VIRHAGADDTSTDDDDARCGGELRGHKAGYSPGNPALDITGRDRLTPGEGRALTPLLDQLRCLHGHTITVDDLPGGLTNRNLKVTVGDAAYVVRIAGDSSPLLSINRDDEYYNSTAAAQAGVGAPVIEYRPDLGVLVVGFLDARTCSKDDLGDSDRLRRVTVACRRLQHGPRFRNDFDMFALMRSYLSVVQTNRFRLPPRYLDFLPWTERIRVALAASDEGTVPCHNDLLAENCLDDGRRVWLIDYEYSGNNDPCFELGNLWSEAGLTLDQLDELITYFYGDCPAQKVARARLQGLMSKYGWTLWASIQDGAADMDFDFWSWGLEKYERAVAEFADPAFSDLLDTAAGR
jgi:thiamine kinase-like enzyme